MTKLPTFPLPVPPDDTSREQLLLQYHTVYKFLCAAASAFSEVEFDFRHYQDQKEHAYNHARNERDIAYSRLGDLKTYFESHLIHLMKDDE